MNNKMKNKIYSYYKELELINAKRDSLKAIQKQFKKLSDRSETMILSFNHFKLVKTELSAELIEIKDSVIKESNKIISDYKDLTLEINRFLFEQVKKSSSSDYTELYKILVNVNSEINEKINSLNVAISKA